MSQKPWAAWVITSAGHVEICCFSLSRLFLLLWYIPSLVILLCTYMSYSMPVSTCVNIYYVHICTWDPICFFSEREREGVLSWCRTWTCQRHLKFHPFYREVRNLKEAIELQSGIPADQQRLVLGQVQGGQGDDEAEYRENGENKMENHGKYEENMWTASKWENGNLQNNISENRKQKIKKE